MSDDSRLARAWILTGVAALLVIGAWVATRKDATAPIERSGVVVVRAEGGVDAPAPMPRNVSRSTDMPARPATAARDEPAGTAAAASGIAVSPQQLAERMRSEPRAAAWASASEASIRAALRDIPGLGAPADVRCVTSLCEIAGSFPADASPERTNEAMQALQGAPLADPLARAGLGSATGVFASNAQGGATYRFYFERVVRPASR